jgi:hypothetical protein
MVTEIPSAIWSRIQAFGFRFSDRLPSTQDDKMLCGGLIEGRRIEELADD